jgi:hypothetical protein
MRIPYRKLDYQNYQQIIEKLNTYAELKTDIMRNPVRSTIKRQSLIWRIRVNLDDILSDIPELVDLLNHYGIKPKRAAFIQTEPNTQGEIHIDGNLLTRILFPVRNCIGSKTKFFDIPKSFWDDNGYGGYDEVKKEFYYSAYKGNVNDFRVVDEFELDRPVIFDTSISHGVFTDPAIIEPRISFTIISNNDISHLLEQ